MFGFNIDLYLKMLYVWLAILIYKIIMFLYEVIIFKIDYVIGLLRNIYTNYMIFIIALINIIGLYIFLKNVSFNVQILWSIKYKEM